MFLGKDEQGKPVLVPRDTWRKTNIQILGLPGSGKSVMATNALIRCVRDFGDAVVYFDPKGDAWAHVFRRTVRTSPCCCRETGAAESVPRSRPVRAEKPADCRA
ncbi:hypothetical protein BANRA_05464 [Klebsiella pneumoniae]|uniref:type IV secretory system conjugative DNA transfer family protein n=1 Tax=Klebsiella pneumoniae TaxID=573 RepID=UPI000F1A9016|nr:type IV secretory system conjugative DNA transfer family protein [Klebsiella pneumoniae]VCY26532.1 hypothetical protein BANRA_05464 [Klebsiella pneumoniae]